MNREVYVLSLLNDDGVGNAISRFLRVNRDAGNFPLTDQLMAAGGRIGAETTTRPSRGIPRAVSLWEGCCGHSEAGIG